MAIYLNYQAAALRVCIDRIEGGTLCGRIGGQRLRAPVSFSDLNDFCARVNDLLDVQRFPQAFHSVRSFAGERLLQVSAALSQEEMTSFEEVQAMKGEIATFLVQVTARQNSTWQGYIDWLDESPKQFFNSTLEFVKFVVQKIK